MRDARRIAIEFYQLRSVFVSERIGSSSLGTQDVLYPTRRKVENRLEENQTLLASRQFGQFKSPQEFTKRLAIPTSIISYIFYDKHFPC
jgi:hypothetical protein